MRIKMMWIRILSAAALFLILAQANVWADTQAHLVLAVGYRAFLIAAPLFLGMGLSTAMRMALTLCVLGTVGALFSVNAFSLGILALGMAISGYFAKYVAAHTSQGAAENKVSLNIGSLSSGLLLMTMMKREWALSLMAVLLIIALFISFKVDWNGLTDTKIKGDSKGPEQKKFKWLPLVGWSLIGVATGIKLTGMFAILPQYLILTMGGLPPWFGSLMILNSLAVILLQHRILKWLDRSAPYLTLILSFTTMLVLALPGILKVEKLGLSVVWIMLLTVGECALSRYDRLAKEDGYLFFKELMVGIGSLATVTLSRSFTVDIYWSGVLGMFCLVIGVWAIGRVNTGRLCRSKPLGFFRAPSPDFLDGHVSVRV